MSLRFAFAAIGISTFAFACSSADKYVMPGADGVNHVNIRKAERADAEAAAIKIAKKYCHKRDKEAVFVNPNVKTEYTGTMDEETRTNVRQISKAAGILGGGYGAGANPVGSAGVVGMEVTGGQDYHSTLDFKCQ
jgi:hypothetical protein